MDEVHYITFLEKLLIMGWLWTTLHYLSSNIILIIKWSSLFRVWVIFRYFGSHYSVSGSRNIILILIGVSDIRENTHFIILLLSRLLNKAPCFIQGQAPLGHSSDLVLVLLGYLLGWCSALFLEISISYENEFLNKLDNSLSWLMILTINPYFFRI
jgi:hypothetical protein